MDFNFDLRRLLLFAALLAGFALLGGFSQPELSPESMHRAAQVHKAWFYCMALYVVGAAAVSLVDHWTGTMEPLNLRLLYIILGVLLMGAGALWLRVLKQTVEPAASRNSGDTNIRSDPPERHVAVFRYGSFIRAGAFKPSSPAPDNQG